MEDKATSHGAGSPLIPARLHYLDWLRVLAILMVFLFHAIHPFDFGDWQIKNAEQSEIITIILVLLSLWGMPFFFLVAGAGSCFALQRRTARQYISERFKRLLIPFFVGTILFSPLQFYLQWLNKTQLGVFSGSFQEFMTIAVPPFNPLLLRGPGFSPSWFGIGFHLWFLGFLFSFALITLPLFRWMKGMAGKRLLSRLAGLCEKRGTILLLVLPLLVIQLSLRPFFSAEHDWADFIFQMAFFILGYLLFLEERFLRIIRRDWWLLLSLGVVIVLGLIGLYVAGYPVITWGDTPGIPQFYIIQGLVTMVAFCFTLTMLFVGMRFLDFTNRWLRYAQEAALPFFVLHQPIIIAVAYFVVQWNIGITVKLPVVVLSSFIITLSLYEFVIRRVNPLRVVFGMKARFPDKPKIYKINWISSPEKRL